MTAGILDFYDANNLPRDGACYLFAALRSSPETHLGFITVLLPTEKEIKFHYENKSHTCDVAIMKILRQGSQTKAAIYECNTKEGLRFILKAGYFTFERSSLTLIFSTEDCEQLFTESSILEDLWNYIAQHVTSQDSLPIPKLLGVPIALSPYDATLGFVCRRLLFRRHKASSH